jgi:hypothetical protein
LQVALYVGRGGIGKRPVLEYSAAVRAGAPAQTPKGCIGQNCTVPPMASAPGIIADLERFLKVRRKNRAALLFLNGHTVGGEGRAE